MAVALSLNNLLDCGDIHPRKAGKVDHRKAEAVRLTDKIRFGISEAGLARLLPSRVTAVDQFVRFVLCASNPFKVSQSTIGGIAVQMRTNEPGRALTLERLQNCAMQPNDLAASAVVDCKGEILPLPIRPHRSVRNRVSNMPLTRNIVVSAREPFPSFHPAYMADFRASYKDESAVAEGHAANLEPDHD